MSSHIPLSKLDNTDSKKPEFLGIKTLKAVLTSEGYRKDLGDLSFYAAHIKQERPMLFMLTKHLCKLGFEVVLEKKIHRYKYDLAVNNNTLEAKFYYEGDIELRFEGEMDKYRWNFESLKREVLKRKGRSLSWSMALPIIKDIFIKTPRIFMLIILSRDLITIKDTEPKLLEQICWSKYETKYNEKYGYNNERYLKVIKKFFNHLEKKKHFKSAYLEIKTDTMFPSSYHIFLCDLDTKQR
jgi:hypothetical protein